MQELRQAEIIPFRRPDVRRLGPAELSDMRFRGLVGEQAWAALPQATRARFGKRVSDCRTVLYVGEIVECRRNVIGWLLAECARIIGGPLPTSRDTGVPASVAVTEDVAFGGQFWTRVYGRRSGFPQVIHSSKRFAGPTGLEEYVGYGLGIALRCTVENEALHFDSDHYFVRVCGLRLRIPTWLQPGQLRVSHIDCNHRWFAFQLVLRHGLFGELIRQTVMFREVEIGT